MRIKNPFCVTFGEEPEAIVSREIERNEILRLFQSESPESKIQFITGPRGVGKTVWLRQIKKYFDDQNDWVAADLTQYSNMLEQLAGKLYENGKLKRLFLKAEFNFSFQGFGFSLRGDNPISNVESLLDHMFLYLKSKGKRVLVTIDDVSNNDFMKQFAQAYQSMIRSDYPIFLLMTGLYENVSALANTKNLTFLLRAPKMRLGKLSLRATALAYKTYLGIDEKEAISLARTVKGYAYAFQLVGNVLYQNTSSKLTPRQMDSFDIALDENIYSKIWESMSSTDRTLAFALLEHQEAEDLQRALGINNAKYQVYRRRLVNMGIVDDKARGSLTFSLPRFKEFVAFQKGLAEE